MLTVHLFSKNPNFWKARQPNCTAVDFRSLGNMLCTHVELQHLLYLRCLLTSHTMKKITVFCGSSAGKDPKFKKTAFQLGKTLAKKEIGVVYGGGRVGLMGAVADGAMKHKGTVIGIIPIFLATKEIAHHGLTELIVVDTMHERKMLMSELCDGVIALPGGFGTMEELFEMLTWTQLGLHQKPVGLLNTNGYFDDLLSFIQKMIVKV